jgi:hypothetical protein
MNATRIASRLTILCLFSLAVMGMLAACGGDDAAAPGGGGGVVAPDASFLECWVQGLEFSTATKSGLTEEYGIFDCELGNTMTFHVGGIELGGGAAGPFMNPIEITSATDIFEYEPTNIACFLQTIDDDGNPPNGIVITEAVRTAAAGKTLDFDQRPADFAANAAVQQLISDLTAVTAAGTRTLVAYVAARTHLQNTLMEVLAGEYGGRFHGTKGTDEWEGEWEIVIKTDGTITGTFEEEHGRGDSEMTGTLQPGGSFSCSDQGGVGLLFAGKIERSVEDGAHIVTGSWNDYEQGSGTFSGDRHSYPAFIACP